MAAMFSQAQMIPVTPSSKERVYLTLEDIIPNIVADNGNVHGAPTRVIVLENTISGKIVPVEEIRRIWEYARGRDIKVHLDGARLWNACHPGHTGPAKLLTGSRIVSVARESLRAYCACVDSVTLCFSKSLGAPCGSILLSNSPAFIGRARHFRKAIGGGMRQAGFLTAPARVAIDEVFLSEWHLTHANLLAKRLELKWKNMGGQVPPGLEQETNFVWLDLDAAGVRDRELIEIARQEGVKVGQGGRIATHFRKTFIAPPSSFYELKQFSNLRRRVLMARNIPRSNHLSRARIRTRALRGEISPRGKNPLKPRLRQPKKSTKSHLSKRD